MKTFKEFLEESSLSRIKSKSDKGGMAVLSGSRGDKSKKENKGLFCTVSTHSSSSTID